MSPLDVPVALALIGSAVVGIVVWALWVWRTDIKPARAENKARAAQLPRCHVTGCPVPGYVPVTRTDVHGRWEVIHVCHGHADEGQAYGWWLRQQGWRSAS